MHQQLSKMPKSPVHPEHSPVPHRNSSARLEEDANTHNVENALNDARPPMTEHLVGQEKAAKPSADSRSDHPMYDIAFVNEATDEQRHDPKFVSDAVDKLSAMLTNLKADVRKNESEIAKTKYATKKTEQFASNLQAGYNDLEERHMASQRQLDERNHQALKAGRVT